MEDGDDPHAPFLYSNHIYKMLNNALDVGISEHDFWEMTFAELDRLIESKRRVKNYQDRERATFDYILASLIGRAFAASMDNKATFPDIYDVYPSLFSEEREEKRQEVINQLSALRFKQFAQSYNNKFKNKEVANDNE